MGSARVQAGKHKMMKTGKKEEGKVSKRRKAEGKKRGRREGGQVGQGRARGPSVIGEARGGTTARERQLRMEKPVRTVVMVVLSTSPAIEFRVES